MIERRGAKPREVYQPLRVAISGSTISPGMFESLALIGRDEALGGSTGARDERFVSQPSIRRSSAADRGLTLNRRPGWPANPRKGYQRNAGHRCGKEAGQHPELNSVKSDAPPRQSVVADEHRAAPGARHQNEGHGRRLTMAFEALEAFPALAESRNRLLAVIAKDHVATADIVSAVESDVALDHRRSAPRQPRAGRRGQRRYRRRGRRAARPQTVQALAGRARTFDFFERASVWDAAPERFRLHALATQRAADRVATEVGYENRDRLTVTSLLHDIGKLVLLHAYPAIPSQVHRGARTPEERIHQERRELGVDHALVGGVLVRRWGLPALDRRPDRAPPQPRRRGRGGLHPARRHARPLRAGRPRRPGRDASDARAVGLGRRSCAG